MGLFTTASNTWAVGNKITSALLNGQLRDLINGFGAYTAYTPTWGATSAPAIGNGTISGGYTQVNKTVFFRIAVVFGTTTTFGTGNWTITIPVAPSAAQNVWTFGAYGITGGAAYALTCDVNGGTTVAAINYQSSVAGVKSRVNSAAPVAWAASAGNGFWINGQYEAA